MRTGVGGSRDRASSARGGQPGAGLSTWPVFTALVPVRSVTFASPLAEEEPEAPRGEAARPQPPGAGKQSLAVRLAGVLS